MLCIELLHVDWLSVSITCFLVTLTDLLTHVHVVNICFLFLCYFLHLPFTRNLKVAFHWITREQVWHRIAHWQPIVLTHSLFPLLHTKFITSFLWEQVEHPLAESKFCGLCLRKGHGFNHITCTLYTDHLIYMYMYVYLYWRAWILVLAFELPACTCTVVYHWLNGSVYAYTYTCTTCTCKSHTVSLWFRVWVPVYCR